jgi:putative lipoic acid-binding regulatory protein
VSEGVTRPEVADDSEAARARALGLLEATHQFPCAYSVTVIAFNRDGVTAAVRAAAYLGVAESPAPEAHQSQESREGKYRSHRLAVPVPDAPAVLALYARLRAVEGVVTLL